MIETGLRGDAEESRRLAIRGTVIVVKHVALAHAHPRIGDDLYAHLFADRDPLLVHRLDQSTRRVADAFFIEQEITACSLDARGVGERYSRMDNGLAFCRLVCITLFAASMLG